METELILVDTNIVIEVLKNNLEIVEIVKSIGIENIAVSSITLMELYYGAFNKEEVLKIKQYVKAFETIHIDSKISVKAVGLIEKYARGHNLNLPDALIAATVIENNLQLFTLNLKDFRYIEGLRVWNSETTEPKDKE